MSELPTDLRYTKDHEWVRPTGDAWAVGITHFAVEQLGDITLVDLPREGDMITKGQRFGTIESVKSVSDLYAPLSGKVVKVNDGLRDQPELINSDCYAGAWMIEVAPSDKGDIDDLMDSGAYATHIAG